MLHEPCSLVMPYDVGHYKANVQVGKDMVADLQLQVSVKFKWM